MKVKDLALDNNFQEICLPCPDREIGGVYVGDLLSWVMGRANADDAWITIMSNLNVIAVASLADTSCVILTEGVTLPEDVKALALSKEINVLSTSLTSYQAAVTMNGLLK